MVFYTINMKFPSFIFFQSSPYAVLEALSTLDKVSFCFFFFGVRNGRIIFPVKLLISQIYLATNCKLALQNASSCGT